MTDADIIFYPFRGIRYRRPGSSDLSDLISPPFDVISEEKQTELYVRSAHNFVRVELAQGEGESRHDTAAGTLASWLEQGVLAREEAPVLYLLEQQFSVGHQSWKRRGVFGLMRLPTRERNYVLAHEGTLPEAKADRLRLMRACRAMASPLMLMSEDPEGTLLGLLAGIDGKPNAVAEDQDGVVSRLWVIRDTKVTGAISQAIGPGPLYIADGHHRFATACTYRDEMQAMHSNAPAEAAFNHALALVNSARDDGLRIFPTHRLVWGLDETALERLRRCMEQYFEVREAAVVDPEKAADLSWLQRADPKRPVLGAYGRGHLYQLAGRDEAAAVGARVVERLDVSVLHRRLIDPTLAGTGCDVDSNGRISHDSEAAGPTRRGARLTYATDAAQAIRAVDRGDYDFAFFLRPTRVSEVMAAAQAGELMPGKSTYFYPKIPAGLVLSDATEEPI
jgi:uncharacterized protein (DUF1015 family)